MRINLHKNATTTPAQREWIQSCDTMNTAQLARTLGISETTVRKWKGRESVFDRPHEPKRTRARLRPVQEILVVLIRQGLRPGLDDLLAMVRSQIAPGCSRSGLSRCLARYDMPRIKPFTQQLKTLAPEHKGSLIYCTCLIFWGHRTFRGIHLGMDCRTRLVYAQDFNDSRGLDPRLFWEKLMARSPVKIRGFVSGGAVWLSHQIGTGFNTHTYDQRIKRFCQERQLAYTPGDQAKKDTRTALEKTIARMAPEQLAFRPEWMEQVKGYLLYYNTEFCQKALKKKTAVQTLNNLYVQFPGSFTRKPEQSIETFLEGK